MNDLPIGSRPRFIGSTPEQMKVYLADFTKEELETLCFYLQSKGVPQADLERVGGSKKVWAIRLVKEIQNAGKFTVLVLAVGGEMTNFPDPNRHLIEQIDLWFTAVKLLEVCMEMEIPANQIRQDTSRAFARTVLDWADRNNKREKLLALLTTLNPDFHYLGE